MIDSIVGDIGIRTRTVSLRRGSRGFEELALPRAIRADRIGRSNTAAGGPGVARAAVASGPDHSAHSPSAHHRSSRAHGSTPGPSLLESYVIAAARALWSVASGVLTKWQRRHAIRATRRALLELDERALRDLGLSRPEIGSIACELTGDAEPTRQRVLQPAGS